MQTALDHQPTPAGAELADAGGGELLLELRERAERLLEYTFINEDLLKEALTHASSADTRLQSTPRLGPAHHAHIHDPPLWWNN